MSACENAARSYLSDRYVRALTGGAIHSVDEAGRLAQALANWDIQAHRALAGHLEPTSILLIARTQCFIASATLVIVDAATSTSFVDPTDRLTSAISEVGRSWSSLASRWGDLAKPDSTAKKALVRAAGEVRASCREITHEASSLATTEVIASRPGLREAAVATLRAIEAGSELAHVVAEKAADPDLCGPARALSRRAQNDIESGLVAAPPEGDVVWISPADILAKRWVPLPKPVAEALRSKSAATVTAAGAASRVVALDVPAISVRGAETDVRMVRASPEQTCHLPRENIKLSGLPGQAPFGQPTQ